MTRAAFRGVSMACVTLACSWSAANAQQYYDTPPDVAISTDKSSYDRFEPVLVTVTVTNTSNKRQQYGETGYRMSSAANPVLISPTGESVMPHKLYHFEGGGLQPPSTFEPGESRTREFLLNVIYPVWAGTGTYTLRVYYSLAMDADPYVFGQLLASTSFEVNDLQIRSTLVDSLLDGARLAFDQFDPYLEQDENLLYAVANDPETPAYVSEFAMFARALRTEGRFWRSSDKTLVDQRFSDFLSTYPNSAYFTAANQQIIGMQQYFGADPPYDQYDSTTFLRLKVYLEGAYLGGDDLKTTLWEAGQIPADHPFDTTPWNNIELDRVWLIPDSTAAWLLVTLVDSLGAPIDSAAGMLVDFGPTVADVEFANLPSGSYRVIVDHRNHLAIASDTLVDFTTGYTSEHDFTTGHAYTNVEVGEPQKKIAVGQDTVYAMFAGDYTADGWLTSSDFDGWLSETRVAASGYVQSDYNLDGQSTTADHTRWELNIREPAEIRFPCEWLYPCQGLDRFWAGESSEAAPKTAVTEDDIRVRYRLTGGVDAGFGRTYIDLKQNTGGAEVDTLGSATFDVYFNSEQMSYDYASHYVDLLEAGYSVEINEGVNEHGSFMRVDIYTWNPDTVSYDVASTWENAVVAVTFDDTGGQITEHGLGMNLSTMDVVLVSDGVYREAAALIPEWADASWSY